MELSIQPHPLKKQRLGKRIVPTVAPGPIANLSLAVLRWVEVDYVVLDSDTIDVGVLYLIHSVPRAFYEVQPKIHPFHLLKLKNPIFELFAIERILQPRSWAYV